MFPVTDVAIGLHKILRTLCWWCKGINVKVFLMQNTSMVSFDGGSASKVDDVTALPSRQKVADVCYYGNVMITTRWCLCVTMETSPLAVEDVYTELVIDVFYIFNSTVID